MSDEDDLRLYLDTFYGDNKGYVIGALTRNPRVVDGKYKIEWVYQTPEGKWRSNGRAYKWPERREDAVADMLGHDCDVPLCPYLMTGRKRHQGASVPETRKHVHADTDEGHPDWVDRIRAIPGGVAIGSGTPGNGHGYVLLTRPVPLHHHEQLNKGLGEHLGTKDNTKFHDNDCLRPAGTKSYKPTVMNGGGRPPAPVTWLIRPNGERIDPDKLAGHLGIELTDPPEEQAEEQAEERTRTKARTRRRGARGSFADEPSEQVDLTAWHMREVAEALAHDTGDRSADIMRVVGVCKRSRLTLPQTRWVVRSREDLAEKLDELTHDDVERCFNKATDSHDDQHQEEAMSGNGQEQDTPDAEDQQQRAGVKTPTDAERAAEADFWLQRSIFVRVHQFARSRRKNPYAVLLGTLRRAITMVPPRVQLPHNDVGTATSANLFTAHVGRSGQGKDGAAGVAREAVGFFDHTGTELEDPPSPSIGTGEGLARLFKGFGNNTDQPAENQDRVHLEVNEVGTLESLADRKGGTLVGELLKAFMGQSLGFSNASRATTTHIRAQSYRLCLGVGVQPENAGFFFEREKDGVPQRFFWAPIANPYALPPRRGAQKPVPPLEVTIPEFRTLTHGGAGTYLIRVPDSVREEIVDFHYLVEIESPDVDPLDGHIMLVRLKVAFGLALLEGRQDIIEEDWRIAGQLIEVSNRVRAQMRKVVAERHRKKNIARAHDQADRDAIISEKLTEVRQKRVLGAITRKLKRVGVATERELMLACDSSIREDFPTVFDLLLDQRYLVVDGGEGTDKRYRLSAV